MPEDIKQLRPLLAGFSYYRTILADISERLHAINGLLKQGVRFIFAPDMEAIVPDLLGEISSPRTLVFPDWG